MRLQKEKTFIVAEIPESCGFQVKNPVRAIILIAG